jgi:probable HAF family extracellular repeat protein
MFPYGSTSIGNGVNRSGQVTGYALVAGPCLHECMHAFLYSDGNMLDLGTLPGGNLSVGNGINSGKQRKDGKMSVNAEGEGTSR